MDSKEVIEKLNHIRRYPHDSSASDAIDDLFDEWRRQAERIAELESEKVRLTTICAALNKDNEKLRTLAHQKINELIDALDKITELEAKVNELQGAWEEETMDYAMLKAEVERLRWHYPDKGELSDENIKVLCNKADEVGDFVGVLTQYGGKRFSIGGRLTPTEDITRWRYID